MKNIILLFTISFSLVCCGKKESSQAQPVFKSYGESFDHSIAAEITDLSSLMADSDSVSITLSGQIEKTCAVKGCWMQLNAGEQNTLRVTFKDYGFFVPKSGVEGKTSIVQGYCVRQETSVEELRHFAQDAGESAESIALIISPKMEYNFVASGVIIQD